MNWDVFPLLFSGSIYVELVLIFLQMFSRHVQLNHLGLDTYFSGVFKL